MQQADPGVTAMQLVDRMILGGVAGILAVLAFRLLQFLSRRSAERVRR
jgi:hypothetical protein